MKSIKEKAEAYDKVLEWATEAHKVCDGMLKEDLEHLFPELKESEDERIRKEILDCFRAMKQQGCFPSKHKEQYDSWIAWLEKQGGEQNLTLPKWKYKKDNTPLLRDSLILNKYGCVAKSPSGALVSDVWVIDYAELAKLPKEEIEKQSEQKPDDDIERKYNPCYNMSFEEAQEYISNRGFDIPWTDCDVFVDFRYVTQTVANILRWADNNPRQMPADKVEPKFKVGDHIKPIDKCLGSPRIIEEVCDSWYVTDKGTLDFEYENNWELAGEPVSEELEKVVEEIVEPTILNAYGTKELARRLRNTICGTCVSEELEDAAFDYAEACKYEGGEKLLCVEHFKAGAKWQFNQLEKNRLAACDRASKEEIEREQDFCDKIIIGEHRQPTFSDAIEYGMRLQKEQMMSNSVDSRVYIDAGGYPYIPQMELYDYDKDVPLAKEGDKYKVILIKEQCGCNRKETL